MDALVNGELSDGSLSKNKESNNSLNSEKCPSEAKKSDDTLDNSKSELSSQCTLDEKAHEPSTKLSPEVENGSKIKESTSLSTDSNIPATKSDSSSIEKSGDLNLDVVKESTATKENGILDSDKQPDAVTEIACSSEIGDSSTKNKEVCNTDVPDDLVDVKSTSKKLSEKAVPLLEEESGLNSNASSCSKTSVKTDDLKDNHTVVSDKNSTGNVEANVKNHFMAGGFIISSDETANTEKDSDQSFKSSEVNSITNVAEKGIKGDVLSESSSSVSKIVDTSEQPLNFTKSSNMELTTMNKTPLSILGSSECLVDSSANKYNPENPLAKLNEHLKSIGSENEHTSHNHTQKSDLPSLCSSSSHPVTQKSDSTACDKENRCMDSPHLQERNSKDSSDSFVFAELSNEETGFPAAFTGLVTIGKYISVKGDFTLRSTEALVESPSLVAPYLLKEPDSFPAKDKDSKSEIKDFFHSAAGEILIGIGLSRVNEWFHRDMVRIKKRQIKKAGKSEELEKDLSMHENFYSEAKKANGPYSFTFKVCKTCGFTTESSIVMEGHLLVPHITQRREYQCNFCDVIDRDPKGMLEHMQKVHRKIGRIQPPVLFFECPYCTFESNSKVKLNNHLAKCQRYFDHGINQAPPKDFEFPALTPKPITVAVVKAYEKSLGSMQRGRGRPKKDDSMHMNQFSPNANISPMAPNHVPAFRASSNSPLTDSLSMQNQIIPPMQMPNMNLRPAHANAMGQLRPGISPLHIPPSNRYFQVVNPTGQIMPIMGSNHLVTSPSQFPFSQNLDNSGGKKQSSTPYFNSMFGSNLRPQNSAKGMSSVTITPLPKLQGPYPVPMGKPTTSTGSASLQSSSLVVCEICDGYIKDLEQLRTHMQLIHKVKIHPKMLVSRPPLNCQKCQWRFFTDQGLERHLLGAHGLVTSNMQELANKGKDAGCCTICGRVYASKLVSHMNQVHKITLKPAHLSYKCTVCSATFNLYRLFENHVYLVHSGAAKRSADGRSSPSKKLKTSGDSDGESLNHTEKLKDIVDENVIKCKECGKNMSNDKKLQNDKCEKCLKSEESLQGTKTLKDELRKKDKAIEKAAA